MSVITTCVWRRCFRPPIFAAGIDFATYHTSNVLLSEKTSHLKRIRTVSANSRFQPKPGIFSEKGTQSKDVWNSERPTMKHVNKRADVSSELQKLTIDDEYIIATKRDGRVKQKPGLTANEHIYEYVFGISPCLLAITHGRRKIYGLFVKEGTTSARTSVLKVCEEAYSRGVPIHHVSKKTIEKMVPGRVHQGVCLQASPLTYVTEKKRSSHLSVKDENIPPLWLVIESVQDPMNLGAILRSAYFLGVDRVISSISHSCPLSPVVSKASSGSMEVMEVYGYTNLCEILKQKKALGWDVVGTVGFESGETHATRCSDFTVTKPTLLLIGGEGEGLSQELQSHCQTLLTIPAGRQLFTGIESLNVSVATGILLYSLLFSRGSNKPK